MESQRTPSPPPLTILRITCIVSREQVTQTFITPVDWQIAEIRKAFWGCLPRARPGVSDRAGFPRPCVVAEIVRGPFPHHLSTSPATGGAVEGAVGERLNTENDFDFREAFIVYEDRELVACAPLREVSHENG